MKKYLVEREDVSFNQLFPEVKSLNLKGKEIGELSSSSFFLEESKRIIFYDELTIQRKIPCSNPKCQQGGYEIQLILESLIRRNDEKSEGKINCNGHEGTPKGRKNGNSCWNSITYKIDIIYNTK